MASAARRSPLRAYHPHKRGAEREPEDQSGCGADVSSGDAGVAGGVEVEDGAGVGEDLADLLALADEYAVSSTRAARAS